MARSAKAPCVSLIRRIESFLASVGVAFGLSAAGVPADLAAVTATAMGQLLGDGPKRSRADVLADQVNHANRARAYEAFGASIAEGWLNGGFLFTFKPQLVGYVHGMVGLMRAQKRFEEQTTRVMSALSTLLLYASTEMLEASAALLRAQTDGLTEISRCRPVTAKAATSFTTRPTSRLRRSRRRPLTKATGTSSCSPQPALPCSPVTAEPLGTVYCRGGQVGRLLLRGGTGA